MKNNIISFAVGLLIMFLLMKKCDNGTTTVSIPEKKGKFEAVKPKHDTIILTKIVKLKNGQNLSKNDKSEIARMKSMYNFSQNEIDSLLNENAVLTSELTNLKVPDTIVKEIEKKLSLKEFSKTFEDSILKADVTGLVSGKVERLALNYTTKKQSVHIKNPIVIMLGASAGINKELNKGVVQANAIYQNRKNKQFTVSFLRADNQQYYLAGVNVPVFRIK